MDAEFFAWHYSEGVQFFISRWKNSLEWIIHYFSLPLLLSSLFSSYKRLNDTKKTGFNPNKYFEKLSFNLISRGVGAVTRLSLFSFGLGLYLLTAITGLLGIALWFILPFIGLPFYSKYKKHPSVFAKKLKQQLVINPESQSNVLFDNVAGEFVLKHLQLTLQDIKDANISSVSLNNIAPSNYSSLIEVFIESPEWPTEFFRRRGIMKEDFIVAANWWDRKTLEVSEIYAPVEFGRPGVGLELLFGYTPTLNKFSQDLATPQSFAHHLIGREKVVSRLERTLTSGNSALVIGTPGVGKKTVVLEFANKAAKGQLGTQMAYRRVLEFDYNAYLANIPDLPNKKTKLGEVFFEAAAAGNIILVMRDIHRLTNPDVEGIDFTDVFEKFLERKDLKIIALSTNTEYERYISQNLRLRKFFEVIEVDPPKKEEAMQILVRAAENWEIKKNLLISVGALRAILDGSDRYLTETPFPEKAIELLDNVITFSQQNSSSTVTASDVNTVLSEKTGISFARLTDSERKQLSNLEDILHEGLIAQDSAVSLIAKSLRGRSAGVREENRPIGSFLFLGPTGVGKTQTAKVLAKVYYGSENQLIRFDMAEFATSEGISRLIGSMQQNQPGALTTAIKNRPASLLLLDEIEKAPPEIFNLLLTLLDEGYITDAFGRKISCQHLFVIATSNAGAEFIREQVSRGVNGDELQKNVTEYIQTQKIFSPELLNRFDGVVVYEPLSQENLVSVAKLQLDELAKNLQKKDIFLKVTPQAATKVAEDGYDPAFGARPMRRVIDLTLGDLIGTEILKNEVQPGDHIEIIPGTSPLEYRIEKVQE